VNNVFVRCDACMRAEGKYFQHLALNIVSEHPVLTATYSMKRMDLDSLRAGIAASAAVPDLRRNGCSEIVTSVFRCCSVLTHVCLHMCVCVCVCVFMWRTIVKSCLSILSCVAYVRLRNIFRQNLVWEVHINFFLFCTITNQCKINWHHTDPTCFETIVSSSGSS